MAIMFKDDTEASFDGINTRKYSKGTAYEAKTPMERIIFAHFVATGKATKVVTDDADPAPNLPSETKVRRPASKKSE